MKYKKIITSGCSFSHFETPYVWPHQLEIYCKKFNPNLKFDHRGLGSQGQELIQKKGIHAIEQALEEGYKPDEICLFVMWSSNDRKSFYVDNQDFIDDIVKNWSKSNQSWRYQFADLQNKMDDEGVAFSSASTYNEINYNRKGGWFITSCHVMDEIPMVKDYFMMSRNANSVAAVHTSLENIIFLQTYCKAKGIKLYQQLTIPYIMEDFNNLKDHKAINYLYKQLDFSQFISTTSMLTYLKKQPECFKSADDVHPNGLGHRIWLNEVIVPHLQADDFFGDL